MLNRLAFKLFFISMQQINSLFLSPRELYESSIHGKLHEENCIS